MFLDIGAALIITKLLTEVFHGEPTIQLYALGILCVLLPDIDIISPYLRRLFGKKVVNHRTFLHYPIFHLVIACAVAYFSPFFGILYGALTLFHFVHDTFFLGWGIVWLGPFKKTRYKCFPDRDGKITTIPLFTWEEKDEVALIARYHNPHWIRDFYFRPGIIAFLEYSVLVVGLFFVFFWRVF